MILGLNSHAVAWFVWMTINMYNMTCYILEVRKAFLHTWIIMCLIPHCSHSCNLKSCVWSCHPVWLKKDCHCLFKKKIIWFRFLKKRQQSSQPAASLHLLMNTKTMSIVSTLEQLSYLFGCFIYTQGIAWPWSPFKYIAAGLATFWRSPVLDRKDKKKTLFWF